MIGVFLATNGTNWTKFWVICAFAMAAGCEPSTGQIEHYSPSQAERPKTEAIISKLSDCSACPVMVEIPAIIPAESFARYFDGSTIAFEASESSFWISENEITVGQYKACVDEDACARIPYHVVLDVFQPASAVSKIDAHAYTTWLSQKTGENYRLPTELEWLLAASGGEFRPFAIGAAYDPSVANYQETIASLMSPCTLPRNDFGLCNLDGNLAEWTATCADGDFQPCRKFVVRGGDLGSEKNEAGLLRRRSLPPDFANGFIGFRILREP